MIYLQYEKGEFSGCGREIGYQISDYETYEDVRSKRLYVVPIIEILISTTPLDDTSPGYAKPGIKVHPILVSPDPSNTNKVIRSKYKTQRGGKKGKMSHT